jgi:hypothetical protein
MRGRLHSLGAEAHPSHRACPRLPHSLVHHVRLKHLVCHPANGAGPIHCMRAQPPATESRSGHRQRAGPAADSPAARVPPRGARQTGPEDRPCLEAPPPPRAHSGLGIVALLLAYLTSTRAKKVSSAGVGWDAPGVAAAGCVASVRSARAAKPCLLGPQHKPGARGPRTLRARGLADDAPVQNLHAHALLGHVLRNKLGALWREGVWTGGGRECRVTCFAWVYGRGLGETATRGQAMRGGGRGERPPAYPAPRACPSTLFTTAWEA